MPIRPDARRRSQLPSQARHASLSDPLANLSPIEASDVPLCTSPGLIGIRKYIFEIKRLLTLRQSASCMPNPAFAHKIGNAVVTEAAPRQLVAVYTIARTDGCIFGGNSPFYGTQ
jgi:hypothetical protein